MADRMQARLAYRAPDGFGRWSSPGCVLGHGALRMDPHAGGTVQPLRLADGRICLADAYVANFDDVRAKLGLTATSELDDAQLLALAIERWDLGFTDHLHGEFAVALWDPAARRLHLVRDHLGGRPVCYVQSRDMFGFASNSLALVGLPGVPAQLDPAGIVTIWYDDARYLEDTGTAFLGIDALAPAHVLSWQPDAPPRLHRYWRLQPSEPDHARDPREHVEGFREVFGGAVDRAMRGSPQTALMLSGGIDSGAILAARRGFEEAGVANDLLCISAVLAQGDHQPWSVAENRNILAMTEGHPHKLHFRVPAADEPDSLVTPADLAEAAWSFIHPADISLLVPALATRLARKSGCRLILNGVDGDLITSAGLYYIDQLVAEGQWGQAWRESRRATRFNTHLQGRRPAWLFAHALLAALQPHALRRLRSRYRTERVIRGLAAHPVMAPELAMRVDLTARLRRAEALQSDVSRQQRCDHLAHWLAFSLGSSEQIVSRQGLESRHPWCDRQVLEFFQRLPTNIKVRDGWTKWVVRRACEPALGAGVVWHSGKDHLGALLNRQVVEDTAPYLRMLLEDQRLRLNDFVRDDAVTAAMARLGASDLEKSGTCAELLTVAALAGWLRHVNGSK